jgi:hypothetical protein
MRETGRKGADNNGVMTTIKKYTDWKKDFKNFFLKKYCNGLNTPKISVLSPNPWDGDT